MKFKGLKFVVLLLFIVLVFYQYFQIIYSSYLTGTLTFCKYLNIKHCNPANHHDETKFIIFWTTFFREPYSLNELNVCPHLNCLLSNNRSLVNQSAAIIFHLHDLKLNDIPKVRFPWQRYVFHLAESPQHTMFDLDTVAGFFNWTMTYRFDSDIPSLYGLFHKSTDKINSSGLNESDILGSDKKIVVWMVSHCITPSRREDYVTELKKYIPIDIYGSCFGQLQCPISKFEECNKMIGERYKFYLAFENSICKDYITEKFYARAYVNSVPIVLRRKIVQNILPENSYIAADDFSHPKKLAEYLLHLSKNDSAYLTYFRWRTLGYTLDHQHSGHYENYCRLCEKLLEPSDAEIKIYNDLNSWWKKDMCDEDFVANQLNRPFDNTLL